MIQVEIIVFGPASGRRQPILADGSGCSAAVIFLSATTLLVMWLPYLHSAKYPVKSFLVRRGAMLAALSRRSFARFGKARVRSKHAKNSSLSRGPQAPIPIMNLIRSRGIFSAGRIGPDTGI
jgi:hypothetical protein